MKNKGFTLIELVVVISIFSLIISVATSLFISMLQQQRRTLSQQELLNQTSYVVEYMSRALRMAKKDDSDTCVTTGTRNYQITNSSGGYSGAGIRYINNNANGICQEFFWDYTSEMLYESQNASDAVPTFLPLFASYIKIEDFKVALSETADINKYQPRVTIFFDATIGTGKNQVEKQIQTTISQRNLDVQ